MAANGTTSQKVWLITGTSSGLGQEIARAALKKGDIVVATARDPSKLSKLASLGAITDYALDVTSPDAVLSETISRITSDPRTHGRIDILVNNAGYILTGAVEECSAAEVQATFNTNVFGQLAVLRAVLPVMRAQKSGVVANLGSIGGWRGTPAAGLYCATKACAFILSESLRDEVKHMGIKVTCIEPGYFRTNFLAPGHKTRAEKVIEDYAAGASGGTHGALEAYDRKQPGDPTKAAQLIVEALTGTGSCQGKELPTRFVVGKDAYGMVKDVVEQHVGALEEWKGLTTATDCDD